MGSYQPAVHKWVPDPSQLIDLAGTRQVLSHTKSHNKISKRTVKSSSLPYGFWSPGDICWCNISKLGIRKLLVEVYTLTAGQDTPHTHVSLRNVKVHSDVRKCPTLASVLSPIRTSTHHHGNFHKIDQVTQIYLLVLPLNFITYCSFLHTRCMAPPIRTQRVRKEEYKLWISSISQWCVFVSTEFLTYIGRMWTAEMNTVDRSVNICTGNHTRLNLFELYSCMHFNMTAWIPVSYLAAHSLRYDVGLLFVSYLPSARFGRWSRLFRTSRRSLFMLQLCHRFWAWTCIFLFICTNLSLN
jgi:hypothetical protein